MFVHISAVERAGSAARLVKVSHSERLIRFAERFDHRGRALETVVQSCLDDVFVLGDRGRYRQLQQVQLAAYPANEEFAAIEALNERVPKSM